jgi:hypoxanthine phosphoribosyltransferase
VTLEEDTTVEPVPAALSANPARPPFAHASEAEMARILDFYAVSWYYEPRVFPILWNLSGDVIESFSPDFYLPDLDIYLEMTTLKQRLVRKKNRKLRRLRELYPDIRIKLFYARDFRALMLKYGKLALVESLSGSLGQVVPDRSADAIAVSAEVAPAADLTEDGSAVGPTRRARAAAGRRARHSAEAGPAR